jgi:hypothetical protein
VASKTPTSRLAGRDAGSGRFKPVEDARRDRNGSVVERLPLPGYGEGSKTPDQRK